MDSIISAALEEICSQGVNGVLIQDLWARLQNSSSLDGLHLCNGVKSAIWNGILNVPGLSFESPNSSLSARDPLLQSVHGLENLRLRIVAAEHLRDSFVGLDDLKGGDAGISVPQRRALERLAIARENGITQSQLAKEFGMKGNNIFYVVRNLEYRRLIVRQSTIVRTKEPDIVGEQGTKNTSVVNTNLIHLFRYAKHLNLGSQQRIEITKPDTLKALNNEHGSASTGVGASGESIKEDLLVKDYLPSLKAVCDKLEEASGKVLVVSDIKQALGYKKTAGHRAWRNIRNRLKDAHLVEEFHAEVNKKVVSCLRLLKKFDPKNFQPKTFMSGNDDFDTDQPVRCGKRGQITDQLVELPIEHQVHDLIDSAGSKGITVAEVCKRLGLNSKRIYPRLLHMFSRFGMHLQAESHNKSVIYRVWTSRNFNHGSSTVISTKSNDIPDENEPSTRCVRDLVLHEQSSPTIPLLDYSSQDEFTSSGKVKDIQEALQLFSERPGHGERDHDGTGNDAELDMVCKVTELNAAASDIPLPISSTTSKRRGLQRYPCLALTAVNAQRMQRILERLQDEKFVLTAELYRWLEGLEKDKSTPMARKTLTRILKKLQQEGQCKCVPVSVPVVTNCGRSRTTEVVLHPSLDSLPPELLGQIHERLRIFDMQSRGQGLARSKNNQSLPVLTDVKKTSNRVVSDTQAVKVDAMRANGFVPAKMVRAKLLHNFLWDYLSSLPDWHHALSSGKHGYDLKNPHSTCKLFALDAAIKAMPLELFLQVVGSAQKFEDLVESCKRRLCLFDIPVEEYKCLMDTQATGRLSWIIDILRRLKLIRLVTEENAGETNIVPHAVLTHAMELKPYIEEPLSRALLSSSVNSFDLRPRIRHDFILSNREAVDAYWKTLEYCYAAADPTGAVHAFPGSAVREVFFYRSWASVRVMTADQREELLKRVTSDDPDKKIPFKDCIKIARDLNLTVEQVLRAFYDKRLSRPKRTHRDSKPKGQVDHLETDSHGSIARERKRSPKERSVKHVKMDIVASLIPPDTDVENMEQENCYVTPMEGHDVQVQACHEESHINVAEEFEPNEDVDNCSFISQCAFSRLKPTRQRKILWTENLDRKLVIQYTRNRAALGAKFNRTDWASLSELPAHPDACKRRMALLNNNLNVRRAVMKLCNLLGERYAKHLDETHEKELMRCNVSRKIIQDSSLEGGLTKEFSGALEYSLGSKLLESRWDDFEDQNIKMAVEEVLHCKRMTKLEISKKVGSEVEKWLPDLRQLHETNLDIRSCDPQEDAAGKEICNDVERRHKESGMFFAAGQSRSSCHRLPGKFLKLLNNKGNSVSRQARDSLAVANAVELLKLVFLNTSAAPEVAILLAEALRRYSEHDIFTAFNYLREKKFMEIGHGSQPFVLSQKFWQNSSSSPFPVDTGKRADNFASWLHEREQELMADRISLSADLRCGDIFHLFALVSSGELFISPCLPNEGIGEADEHRSLKRKSDEKNLPSGEKAKKQKPHWANDGEFSRREKGFPGIMVNLSRVTISRAEAVESFMTEVNHMNAHLYDEGDRDKFCRSLVTNDNPSIPNNLNPCHTFGSTISKAGSPNESLWEAMTSYAELSASALSGREEAVISYSDLFKAVYIAIHKAGEQGLNMEGIIQVIHLKVNQGGKMAEIISDVLQVYGLVVKVNAYDCVRVVDASYGSKYFLNFASHYQGLKPASHAKYQVINEKTSWVLQENQENACISQKEISMNLCDEHRVTILDLPEEAAQPHDEVQTNEGNVKFIDYMPEIANASKVAESKAVGCMTSGDSQASWPILPWINGDGSTNSIIYKGLTRRVLGTVMQCPGVLEDDLIHRMDVLNPQNCRKLLELMVLDNHLIVRKMYQKTSGRPPSILRSLFKSEIKKPETVCRTHYFANPMSTSML